MRKDRVNAGGLSIAIRSPRVSFHEKERKPSHPANAAPLPPRVWEGVCSIIWRQAMTEVRRAGQRAEQRNCVAFADGGVFLGFMWTLMVVRYMLNCSDCSEKFECVKQCQAKRMNEMKAHCVKQ